VSSQRYAALGLRPVVNASATLTRLGGSLMPDGVLAAMADAAGSFIDLDELQLRVGARLAELTGNAAGYVSCGAAAGITHAVAACIAGTDPIRIAAFPHLDGAPSEVLIATGERNGYDYAVRQTGARIVEYDGSPAGLERARSARTACVVCFAGAHFGVDVASVAGVVEVAHASGVPVIVDAAAQIPPVSSLWRYTREAGADAVIVSGGKGLRGPQSSGMVLGAPFIVEGCRANGSPNSAIGRTMKVGKEEMVGLLAALEWYLAEDEEAMIAGYEASVRRWIDGLADVPGVVVSRGYPNEAGQPFGRAIVALEAPVGLRRDELVRALWEGDPRIAVGLVGEDAVALNAQTLRPGEDETVLARLRAELRRAAAGR
jgi:L-seryl-tRNA(Ser) seleniumtransferase